jgi:hypothetical protein
MGIGTGGLHPQIYQNLVFDEIVRQPLVSYGFPRKFSVLSLKQCVKKQVTLILDDHFVDF